MREALDFTINSRELRFWPTLWRIDNRQLTYTELYTLVYHSASFYRLSDSKKFSQLSLVFTSDGSTSRRISTSITALVLSWKRPWCTSSSTSARIKIFLFPCACGYAYVCQSRVKTEHNAKTRQAFIFFQRKTPVPDFSQFYRPGWPIVIENRKLANLSYLYSRIVLASRFVFTRHVLRMRLCLCLGLWLRR